MTPLEKQILNLRVGANKWRVMAAENLRSTVKADHATAAEQIAQAERQEAEALRLEAT